MQSRDVVGSNVERIAALFPHCITERLNKDGKPELAIDFDKLRAELSNEVLEDGEERYQFTWPDKRAAARLANEPTTLTLRPCREESVNFDNTENLYIEGDNLDVLKVLRETYLGKVKMIYIDPPYNTGNDFVYNDDFAQGKEEFEQSSGLFDAEGNQTIDPMQRNTESNGRFHTDWLNMIYPRIKVAYNLLKDGGVMFISIDDRELTNLKKVCDEIFGVADFIDIFNWAKTETPENLSKKSKQIIEYVLCYQKKKDNSKFKGLKKQSVSSNGLLNQPNAVKTLRFPANVVQTNIQNGIIRAGTYGTDAYDVKLLEDTEVKNGLFIKEVVLEAKFKWSQENLLKELSKGTTIRIPTIKMSPSYEKLEYDAEVPSNLINSKVGVLTNETAGSYQVELFGEKVFNFPKPVSLMQYLMGFNEDTEENSIVLDFFSGSASTAEAVLRRNASNGNNNISFIMVQIQEDLNEALKNASTSSSKEIIQNAIDFCDEHNLNQNICELAKERIRRAGKKVKEEAGQAADGLDTGFRVLKLDSSNMEDVYYTPDAFKPDVIDSLIDNIKPDRTPLDLLFQVMLDLGIELSAKIEQKEIAGKKVFSVDDDYLLACFDTDVNETTIEKMAKLLPTHLVIRDASATNDNVLDNFDQIIESYSNEKKINSHIL